MEQSLNEKVSKIITCSFLPFLNSESVRYTISPRRVSCVCYSIQCIPQLTVTVNTLHQHGGIGVEKFQQDNNNITIDHIMSGSQSFGCGERYYATVCPVTHTTWLPNNNKNDDITGNSGVLCPKCGLVWYRSVVN